MRSNFVTRMKYWKYEHGVDNNYENPTNGLRWSKTPNRNILHVIITSDSRNNENIA